MPNAIFFKALGLYVDENFLDLDYARQLFDEMRTTRSEAATVATEGAEYVQEQTRSTKLAQVSDVTLQDVRARLMSIIDPLNAHFKQSLTSCQAPQFLVYHEGDFFTAHADSSSAETAAEYIRQRTITVSVFVNEQSDSPHAGTYSGGELAFYGLIEGEKWENEGFPLTPKPGMLVAFPSHVVHEVQPITRGIRASLVCWYY